jgi:hypothetical protein
MIEQEACLLGFKLPGSKACEMEHTPKAISPIGEVKPDRSRPHSRIDSAEDYVQGSRNDVRQANWSRL